MYKCLIYNIPHMKSHEMTYTNMRNASPTIRLIPGTMPSVSLYPLTSQIEYIAPTYPPLGPKRQRPTGVENGYRFHTYMCSMILQIVQPTGLHIAEPFAHPHAKNWHIHRIHSFIHSRHRHLYVHVTSKPFLSNIRLPLQLLRYEHCLYLFYHLYNINVMVRKCPYMYICVYK